MKKMIKLSLVAAVAVAGLTSTAAAKDLTEAIQGVDVSGLVRYRLGTKDVDAAGTSTESTTEQMKIVFGLKSKVNDKVTAAVKAVSVKTEDNGANGGTTATINVAKFTYATGALSATVGLMELATPWTDAGDSARANGFLATYNVGPVTLAGAYFKDSNMGGDNNGMNLNANALTALAAIGTAGPVSYQAWYMNISEADTEDTTAAAATSTIGSKDGSALAILLGAKFGPVAVDGSYASLDSDDNTNAVAGKKQTLSKLAVSADLGMAKVFGSYAMGGKDGSLVAFDADSKVAYQNWNIRAGNNAAMYDLDAFTIGASAPVGPVSLKLSYTDAEFDNARVATTKTDINEVVFQVSYKMSKNFNTYFRYADVDQDVKTVGGATASTDTKRTRIELAYSF